MGCGMSTEGPKNSKNTVTEEPALFCAQKKSMPTQNGLDANAQVPQRSPSNSNQHYTLQVFDNAPPRYEPSSSTLPTGFDNFPAGVIVVLNLLKTAAKLIYWGHKGAWAALNERHGQIWLDSAYTLRPITHTAILLYAAVRLLVGNALGSSMTFYFTTFPNLESEQLSALEVNTLNALMKVFNAKTFRLACQLVRENNTALADQGLEDFINNDANFLEKDTLDDYSELDLLANLLAGKTEDK
ncbi:hypothetical protein FJTKL_15379 [Diaporthe vaccinii]|uniref:Uncharacterized protein n=1 Tax=Diaporthe vaccinii TaxID=105482 RepID=A0ABR4E538_9PEZI